MDAWALMNGCHLTVSVVTVQIEVLSSQVMEVHHAHITVVSVNKSDLSSLYIGRPAGD